MVQGRYGRESKPRSIQAFCPVCGARGIQAASHRGEGDSLVRCITYLAIEIKNLQTSNESLRDQIRAMMTNMLLEKEGI